MSSRIRLCVACLGLLGTSARVSGENVQPALHTPARTYAIATPDGLHRTDSRRGSGGALTAASAIPHASLRPIRSVSGGINGVGDTIVVTSPADIILEGYFGGWGSSGQGLKTFQLTVEAASFENGVGVPLTLGDVACAAHADCKTAFAPLSNAPFAQCGDNVPGRCNPFFQDVGRPDYPASMAVFGCSSTLRSCGATTFGAALLDPGSDQYGMTAVIHVPEGAAGTYNVALVNDPDGLLGFTRMELADGTVLGMAELHAAVIQVVPDDKCVGGPLDGVACSQNADCPSGLCNLKNRFLSFNPSAIAPTGGIQVTLVSLDPNAVANPAAYNGTVRWVGPPTLAVDDAPTGTFNAAPIQCAFHSQDWSSVGRLHIYGSVIVPNSAYDVRLCSSEAGPCSAPLRIGTAKFGDVIAPLGATQPNFQDIVAINTKFQGRLGPSKTRCKLRDPVNPSLNINFMEISTDVTAFQGKTYKQLFPAPPPTCP